MLPEDKLNSIAKGLADSEIGVENIESLLKVVFKAHNDNREPSIDEYDELLSIISARVYSLKYLRKVSE